MRTLLITVLLVLPYMVWGESDGEIESESVTMPKAIYGDQDDRAEVMEADGRHQKAARSVAAFFERDSLSIGPSNNEWLLPRVPLLTDNGWCPTERFSNQPAAAFCSGFLMAPDRLVSSAHCVKPDNADDYTDGLPCSEIAVVFDYTLESTTLINGREKALDEQQLYYCEKVLDRFIDQTGADWAVLKLDRPVFGRKPLLPFSALTLSPSTTLSVIGHPLGLPSKVATGAYVLDQSPASYVVTNLDTFLGNSGSPVFVQSEKTGELQVFGILSRGEVDSVVASAEGGGVCNASRICQDFACDGEHVTRITEVPMRLIYSKLQTDSKNPVQRFLPKGNAQ